MIKKKKSRKKSSRTRRDKLGNKVGYHPNWGGFRKGKRKEKLAISRRKIHRLDISLGEERKLRLWEYASPLQISMSDVAWVAVARKIGYNGPSYEVNTKQPSPLSSNIFFALRVRPGEKKALLAYCEKEGKSINQVVREAVDEETRRT